MPKNIAKHDINAMLNFLYLWFKNILAESLMKNYPFKVAI